MTIPGHSYSLYGQLLRLIKAGLDRGGLISSSAFEGSTQILDYSFLDIGKRCTRLQRLYHASKEGTAEGPKQGGPAPGLAEWLRCSSKQWRRRQRSTNSLRHQSIQGLSQIAPPRPTRSHGKSFLLLFDCLFNVFQL